MNKISVIIPVYNTKNTLNRCLESIIKQTYGNIEILLIDDGSTDKSGELCDEWEQKDSRIKAFHKENGGLSSARNYGISKATGDFLSFIDSDDYIDPLMLETLLNGCLKHNADIGQCNIRRIFNSHNKDENVITKSHAVTSSDALSILLLSDPSACNKIFRKNLFENISFPNGKLYEDVGTTPYLIDKANKVFLSPLCGYNYVQTIGSIIHTKFNPKKMDCYFNIKEVGLLIKDKYPHLSKQYECFFALAITTLLTDIYKYRKKYVDEYQLLLNELKKINYIHNAYIPKYKKIMIFFDLHHMGMLVNFLKKIRRQSI